MEAFLQECKYDLEHLEDFSTVKVVMGNESCDLDSAVAALVYALLLRESVGPSAASTTTLAVLNIPQSDLPLKTEIMFYFAENDVPLDLLIFRDQIDLRALHEADKLQLTLVDFHVLTPDDEVLKPSVVEVIDHRPQEAGWEWAGRRVTLEIVGSCCTLIARKVLEAAPGLLTSQVALLLYGPLLLDTVCLSASAGRATPADHHVAGELGRLLPGVARDEVFHLLHTARSNTQGLSAAQLLAKDLKVVAGHTPIPAMQLLLQEYLKRAGAVPALQGLCTSGGYKQAVLMGMKVDEATKDIVRELAVYSADTEIADKLAGLLESSRGPCLELKKLDLPETIEVPSGKLVLYNQGNVKASRKQVLPIVRSFISEITPLRGGGNRRDIPPKIAPRPPNGYHRSIVSNFSQSQGPRSSWHLPDDPVLDAKPYGASNALQAPCSLTAGGLGMEMGSQQEYLTSFSLVCELLEEEKIRRDLRSENGETESPSEEKMDISDASSGSSQLPGLDLGAELVHGGALDNRPTPQPAARTSLTTATRPTPKPSIRPTTLADTDTDNADRLVSLSSALASLKLPASLAEQHLADEPVDFPSSPNQMKLLTRKSLQAQGLPLTEEEACDGPMDDDDEEDPSIYQAVLSPDCKDVRLLKDAEEISDVESSAGKRKDSVDSNSVLGTSQPKENGKTERSYSMASTVDCESLAQDANNTGDMEEYFEDLPLHEGQPYTTTMSRQESFRRHMKGLKVEDAAEFARIGRVVASGELSKHDSIRRKLVGHNSRPALFPTTFEEGDSRALWAKAEQARNGGAPREREDDHNSNCDPLLSYDPTVEDTSLMLMLDKAHLPDSEVDQTHTLLADTTSLNPTSYVDDATLLRVRACFDSESFKDLYTLAGRLQDLLSPLEVEEIIRNSAAYSAILDQRIVSALALAVEEPNAVKTQDSSESEVKNLNEDKKNLSKPSSRQEEEDAEEEEGGFMFVRHDSKRLNEADADRVIEGLFVESRQPPNALQQGRKLLHLAHDILDKEPQSPEDSQKSFSKPDPLSGAERENDGASGSELSSRHAPVRRTSAEGKSEKSLPPNCLVLDVASLARTPQPLSRQLASAPAERQRGHRKKRIAVSADLLNGPADDTDSDEASEKPDVNTGVAASRAAHVSDDEDLEDVSDILSLDTPDELEESIMERLSQQPVAPLPELSAAEEHAEERNWRSCKVAGLERQIDMKVIAPYKRVLHHGGYLGSGAQNAVIVFTACYLPDRSRRDYDYVMDNLFLYVLTTLDQLVAENYVLVYLHGATARSCMPTFSWLKRCYHMIDRRLRKNLKGLYLVHPTFWLKTIVIMTRPFVSTKFSRKLSFVETLTDLAQLVPLEQMTIPERVKQLDFQLNVKKRRGYLW